MSESKKKREKERKIKREREREKDSVIRKDSCNKPRLMYIGLL